MTMQDAIMKIITEQQHQQQEMIMRIVKELRQYPKILTLRRRKKANDNANTDFIPNKVLTTLKTASRMSEPQNTYINPKKLPTANVRAKTPNTIESSKHNKTLRATHTNIGRTLQILTAEYDEVMNKK